MSSTAFLPETITRAVADSLDGPTLLIFGTNWCGHCRAAAPLIDEALTQHASVRQIRVEDGPGRPLGRSYGVKLWPTLLLLRDGVEVERLTRPPSVEVIRQALERIDPPA